MGAGWFYPGSLWGPDPGGGDVSGSRMCSRHKLPTKHAKQGCEQGKESDRHKRNITKLMGPGISLGSNLGVSGAPSWGEKEEAIGCGEVGISVETDQEQD